MSRRKATRHKIIMRWRFTYDGDEYGDHVEIDPKHFSSGELEERMNIIREAWEVLFMQATLSMQKTILGKDENDLISERSKEILDKIEVI